MQMRIVSNVSSTSNLVSAIPLIPLTATILLWRKIYEGKEAGAEIAGYSLGGMISYYLMITIVDAFSAVNDEDWQIGKWGTDAEAMRHRAARLAEFQAAVRLCALL